MRPFQIVWKDTPLMRVVNDVLRQIRDAFDEVTPIDSLALFPDGRTPPTGWFVADGAGGRPDMRAHKVANYVWIVRLG